MDGYHTKLFSSSHVILSLRMKVGYKEQRQSINHLYNSLYKYRISFMQNPTEDKKPLKKKQPNLPKIFIGDNLITRSKKKNEPLEFQCEMSTVNFSWSDA